MVNPGVVKNIRAVSLLVLGLALSGILSWLILVVLQKASRVPIKTVTPTTTATPATPATTTPTAITQPPNADANGFYGPFGKSWSEIDCPVIGTPVQTGTLDECEKLCLANGTCNVINRKVDGTGICRLHRCPNGKRPDNYDSLSKGYSLYPGQAGW